MTRSRTRASQPGSPERSSEDEDEDAKSSKELKSPVDEKTPSRGRKGQPAKETADAMDTKS